jgi:serine/threonine-protein kinase HipA
MTSDVDTAFVWTWLPGAGDPVVAGRLDAGGSVTTFTYGQSYLARPDAIALYLPELPLQRGTIPPQGGVVAGCIADAAPDSWGRRVIDNVRAGVPGDTRTAPGLLTYLLASGSNRIGALDFQESATSYVPRTLDSTGLDELVTSARRVEEGVPLSAVLDAALVHASSVGGARPKALLTDGSRAIVAKFSSIADSSPVVRGEFVAMELAARVGLSVAPVRLTRVLGRDVLLVDRFDRGPHGERRMVVSALTILGLDELGGRYASYADLAEEIRRRFTAPSVTLRELFARITFNILVGNTDDHARNHAAFWDGEMLTLTPAYDICPQTRSSGEARQLMAIGDDGWRVSQVAGCIERAHVYHLFSSREAREIVNHQIDVIRSSWDEVCDAGELTAGDRRNLWGSQFLNEYALEGL